MARRTGLWVTVVAGGVVGAALLVTGVRPFGSESAPVRKVCPVAPAPGRPAPPPVPNDAYGDDYDGDPPHPVTVIDTMETAETTRDGTPLKARLAVGDDPAYTTLPDAWRPPDSDDGTDDSAVQLVACVYYDAIGPALTHCHYQTENGTITLAPTRMTVVVRESSTARTVGTFALRSDPTKTGSAVAEFTKYDFCPTEIDERRVLGPRTWVIPPRNADFVNALRPLATRRF